MLYFLLETDADALNENINELADEYGLLDARYDIGAEFYFRTAPANTNTTTAAG